MLMGLCNGARSDGSWAVDGSDGEAWVKLYPGREDGYEWKKLIEFICNA